MPLVFFMIAVVFFMTVALFLYSVRHAPEGTEGEEGFVFESAKTERRGSGSHRSLKPGPGGMRVVSVTTSGGSYLVRPR